MNTYALGFGISLVVTILLSMLFRFERRRDFRIASTARARFDVFITHTSIIIDRFLRMIGKDSVRQIFHYVLHAFLRGVLHVSRRWEQSLRDMMRANKSLAQNAERERTTLTKLEEIALHKLQTTLTEAEKKKHKDKMLQG